MINRIKVKYHTDIEKLEIIKNGDWIDLRVAEDTILDKGEHKLISLGVSIELQEGYEAHIVPRSSTFKNFGIIQTNHIGIIDNSYSGDNDIWMFSAYATKFTTIPKNSRICQFRLSKIQEPLLIKEVKTLGNKDRGGFGSTGIK